MPFSIAKTAKTAALAFCIAAASLSTTACVNELVEPMRYETAKRLAMPSFMLERKINSGPFKLTVWERIHNKGGSANLYIDGDGMGWSGTETSWHDPTPSNPVALHLATRDLSKNVIYLSRPCHYTALRSGEDCALETWTSERFSPENIASMNAAIDNIARRYDIRSFHLIGYDGGASIVSLIAAQRDDVASIRTVAGRLDYSMTEQYKDQTMNPEMPDASSVAGKITDIPQHHFIGAWDEDVPAYVFDNYLGHAVDGRCIRASIVDEATHEEGWVEEWPTLLKAPLDCNSDL